MDARIAVLSIAILVTGCGESDKPQRAANNVPATPTSAPGAQAPVERPKWAEAATQDPAVACYVDTVSGVALKPGGSEVRLRRGAPILLSGWAVSGKRGGGGEPALVALVRQGGTGTYYFNAERSSRPDVVQNENFRALELVNPGVGLLAATSLIPAGTYQMNVLVRQGESGSLCSLGTAWQIVISE